MFSIIFYLIKVESYFIQEQMCVIVGKGNYFLSLASVAELIYLLPQQLQLCAAP